MTGPYADVINRAKFYLNQFRSFDSVGGRIFGFPIGKKSSLTRLELPFSLWSFMHVTRVWLCHRLNGSSSPVLRATSLSYGESKNSTPHRIKTPDPIEIKFGTVENVGKGTRHAKFYANSSIGKQYFSTLPYLRGGQVAFVQRW